MYRLAVRDVDSDEILMKEVESTRSLLLGPLMDLIRRRFKTFKDSDNFDPVLFATDVSSMTDEISNMRAIDTVSFPLYTLNMLVSCERVEVSHSHAKSPTLQ